MINEGIKMVSEKVLFNTKDSNGAIEEQKKNEIWRKQAK